MAASSIAPIGACPARLVIDVPNAGEMSPRLEGCTPLTDEEPKIIHLFARHAQK